MKPCSQANVPMPTTRAETQAHLERRLPADVCKRLRRYQWNGAPVRALDGQCYRSAEKPMLPFASVCLWSACRVLLLYTQVKEGAAAPLGTRAHNLHAPEVHTFACALPEILLLQGPPVEPSHRVAFLFALVGCCAAELWTMARGRGTAVFFEVSERRSQT